MSIVLTEGKHPGECLVHELPGLMSRKIGKINAGQKLEDGTVLGELLTAGAPTAVGAPTGNGVITIGAAIGPKTQIGTYKLRCVAASANSGTFNLEAPDGSLVRQITVGGGAAPSDHLTVTIADGATDFAVGDSWTVAVSGGDYEAFDPTEDDGAQIIGGVLYGNVDATEADQRCAVIYKTAEVRDLTWPAGITNGQKAAAVAALEARGIVISAT